MVVGTCYDFWASFIFTTMIGLVYYWSVVNVAGEGNGTPLQYSCLENPMGGGAW